MQRRPRRRHSARPTTRTSRRARRQKNFGSNEKLQIDAKPVLRSYLKFDLSSIDGTVTSAVLKLTATAKSTVGFDVREVSDTMWSEGSLTYNNSPAFSPSIGVGSGPFAAKQTTLARRDRQRPGGDPLVRPRRRRERDRVRPRIVGESHALLPAEARGHVHADESADGAVRNRRNAAARRRPRDLDLDGEPSLRRGDRIARGTVREPTGVGMRSRDELPRPDAPELAELHRGDLGQHPGDHRRRPAGLAPARGPEHLQPGQGCRKTGATTRRALPATARSRPAACTP